MLSKMNSLKIRTQIIILAVCVLFIGVFSLVYYYVRFGVVIQERAYDYFSETTDYVEKQVESQLEGIKGLSYQILSNLIVEKYILNDDYLIKYNIGMSLEDYLTGLRSSNSLVDSIYIASLIDNRIIESSQVPTNKYRDLIIKYKEVNTKTALFTDISNDKATGKSFFAYVQPLLGSNYTYFNKNIAMLFIFCETDKLENLLPISSEDNKNIYVLTDENMNILASNNIEKAQKINKIEITDDHNTSDKMQTTDIDGTKYLYYMASIEQIKWKILVATPMNELTKYMDPIFKTSIIIWIVYLFVFILFAFSIIKSIHDPLNSIIKEMKVIGRTDFKKRLIIIKKNEIGLLSNNINMLLDEIEIRTRQIFKAHDDLYSSEISNKHAQLSALQSQINPHFLYNTLECMRSISDYYGIKEVSQICGSMASIFKYCTMLQQYVAIKEEISCINEYFNIIDIRFSDRFSVKVEISSEILEMKIIKMILQPIVENSVYHGLEQKRGKGEILIRGYSTEDLNVILSITDDGVGMSESELEKLHSEISESCSTSIYDEINGIGLINIHRRIRLAYGDVYGLTVSSEQNKGMTVTVCIPSDSNLSS